MDILDILLDILLKPPQPLMGLFLEFLGESLGTCIDNELLLRELAAKIFGLLSCQSIPLRVVHNKL